MVTVFFLCAAFAPVAGAMAYLITLEEMNRHFTDRREPRRRAARAALVTTAFFLVLAGVVVLALTRMLRGV